MAIRSTELRFYAGRPHELRRGLMTLSSAKTINRYQTVFLSHSHKDRDIAEGVEAWLEEKGWTVYIDWKDDSMPESPNRETAEKLQGQIEECDWFLYLATKNSAESRWCPWEIGYADARKGKDRLLILPTTDGGQAYGNEYLQLYRYISLNTMGQTRVYDPSFRYSRQGIPLSSL